MVSTLIIPSYLYEEYLEDDNLQAFVDAFNEMAQAYYNTLLSLNLPIYPNLSGLLLDWVATGLYGYARPVLPSGLGVNYGPLNTYCFNTTPFNKYVKEGPQNFYLTNDDVYIRCLNWHFFKGDGKQFTIPWLKNRVARFIWGPGQPASGETFINWDFDASYLYKVSVTFGADYQVNINIVSTLPPKLKGAIPNAFAFNTKTFNAYSGAFVAQSVPPLAVVFKAAVDAGVLELPFQFTYVVNI